MVINNIDININLGLITCSTDAGITLYTFTSHEISKIEDFKILEGCRLCRLIKNTQKSNVMDAIYLPKSPNTEFCMVELPLPDFTGSSTTNISNNIATNNTATVDPNDTVGTIDYHNKTPVTEYYVKSRMKLPEIINNIHITQDNIITVHDRHILILGRKTYSPQHTINTQLNTPFGLSIISTKDNLLIYTLGTRCGEIIISTPHINDNYSIKCHEHEIQCISTDINEKYLATASTNGTLINVFDLVTKKQIYKFRRGTTSATIYDIAISDDLKWLACCSYSNKGTLHIFSFDDEVQSSLPIQNNNTLTKTKVENKRTLLYRWFSEYTTVYLPTDSYFNDKWSAVEHELETNTGTYHTCKFDKKGILHVASIDGKYFKAFTPSTNYMSKSETKNLCVVG